MSATIPDKVRVYRIKHVKTGLFWIPVKGYSWDRTNLSPTGKLYVKKPKLPMKARVNPSQIEKYNLQIDEHRFTYGDFELVEYELQEVRKPVTRGSYNPAETLGLG